MLLPGKNSKTSDTLGDVLTQYHGFLPFLIKVIKKLYRLNPIDPAIGALKAHILRRFAPFFVSFQLLAALCFMISIWHMPGGLAFILLVFIGILIIALCAYLFLIKERRLTQPPAVYALRIFSICLGLFWTGILFFIFPAEQEIGRLLACLFIMALMVSAVLFLPVAGASILFSGILGLGTFSVVLLAWQESHFQFSYLIGAVIIFLYTIFIVISCAFIRELLISYLIKRYYLEQRNAILSLLLGDTNDIASDWLWETDAIGTLTGISPAFCRALNVTEGILYKKPFVDIMTEKANAHVIASAHDCSDESIRRLRECLQQRIFFRDLIVKIQTPYKTQYWSLSGRPLFQEKQFIGYRGVGTDVTHIHNTHRTASFKARHDALTNIPNRTAFFDDMEFYLVRAEQRQEEFALLNIDLDGFKKINDLYGHHVGDYVLTQIVKILSQALEENDILYRIGGDEFVLIDKNTSKTQAAQIAQKIINKVTMAPIVLKEGIIWHAGLSIGIVMTRGGQETIGDLLSASDLALYESKKEGGNRYTFFDQELETIAQRKIDLLRDLSSAIDNEEIALCYQPFYDAQTQELKGFEALLSWTHQLYGPIVTERIIGIAEDSGLIHRLGLFVLNKAARFACSWPQHLILSINLSAGQLFRKEFVSEWMATLEKTKFPSHRVQIEITETVFMKQSPITFSKLYELRDKGMSIALDDFGKGFSCLGYLYFFPFSKIKMDRLFIRDMLRDQRAATIVKAIVNLTVDLGISLTVEGVESREQYDYIVSLGCAEVQGFYFARPLTAHKVMEFIAAGGRPYYSFENK